jgi:mRNA interferase RelE/StbE
MPTIDIKPSAIKEISILPKKHQGQIKKSIGGLDSNPFPQDYKHLKRHKNCYRLSCGEYRIIYHYDKSEDLVTILAVGKRNDGDVYERFKRSK